MQGRHGFSSFLLLGTEGVSGDAMLTSDTAMILYHCGYSKSGGDSSGENEALFSSTKKNFGFGIVLFLFLFDKYCPIME
jgi:hypothetical protein